MLPSDLRTSVYPLVTQLQERLGQLCDHASACQQLASWRQELSAGPKADYLLKLERQEQQELEESIAQFAKWWTPESANKLQTLLLGITGGRPDCCGEDQ